MYWLTGKLKGKSLWIIIDHCNRRVLTQGARSILTGLAARLHQGALPDVRLIMVDFDRNELPKEWRDLVRHDRAVLPDEKCVEEWCQKLATAARRQYLPGAPSKWAREVFSHLTARNRTDGTWHAELNLQLRDVVNQIMACQVEP
jgi:hypothetical protein